MNGLIFDWPIHIGSYSEAPHIDNYTGYWNDLSKRSAHYLVYDFCALVEKACVINFGTLPFCYRTLCLSNPTLQCSVTFDLSISVPKHLQIYQQILGLSQPCLLASAVDDSGIERLSGSIGEIVTAVTAPIAFENLQHPTA